MVPIVMSENGQSRRVVLHGPGNSRKSDRRNKDIYGDCISLYIFVLFVSKNKTISKFPDQR